MNDKGFTPLGDKAFTPVVPRTSGKAIASLILGFLSFCFSLLAALRR